MSAVPIDHGLDWLRDLRRGAARAFDALGLPHGKQEEWRNSNPAALAGLSTAAPPRPRELHVAHLSVPEIGARVFSIDGHFFVDPDETFPEGVTVSSLAAAMVTGRAGALGELATPEARALTALNTAAFEDGVLIRVDAGAELSKPIHVAHVLATPTTSHPRVLVHVERGARATVVESFAGNTVDALDNSITEVHLEPDAALEHLRWYRADGNHVGGTFAALQQRATYTLHVATIGRALAREEINVSLRGEGAHSSVGGLLLGRGDELVDHQVVLEHAAPETSSEQLFESILDARATGTFAGKVVVREGARGSDARQASRALLLSEHARANAKPHLEIYNDDVRCTHGSTSGQLDETALFYLRARGIGEREAADLLTLAFAGEWLERIRDPSLRESVDRWVRSWLQRARGGES